MKALLVAILEIFVRHQAAIGALQKETADQKAEIKALKEKLEAIENQTSEESLTTDPDIDALLKGLSVTGVLVEPPPGGNGFENIPEVRP
jgi:hypothetical protein